MNDVRDVPSRTDPEMLNGIIASFDEALAGLEGQPPLAATLSTTLTVGSHGQPVVVVDIGIDVPADFAVEDWPAGEVARLKQEIRDRLRGSRVVATSDVDWFLSVHARDAAAAA